MTPHSSVTGTPFGFACGSDNDLYFSDKSGKSGPCGSFA
jgi:hypothetical protein